MADSGSLNPGPDPTPFPLAPDRAKHSQVTCLINGCLVTLPATSGKHTTSCTSSPVNPCARKHALIALIYRREDHATCSEHLTTHVLPAKRDARMGEMRLWKE